MAPYVAPQRLLQVLEHMYESMKKASGGSGGHNNLKKISTLLRGAAKLMMAGKGKRAAGQVAGLAKDVVAGIRGGKQSPVISCNERFDLYKTQLCI